MNKTTMVSAWEERTLYYTSLKSLKNNPTGGKRNHTMYENAQWLRKGRW